jgi:Ran GTPase-activating protein (RanGAP) involved in mRNA processing and transport
LLLGFLEADLREVCALSLVTEREQIQQVIWDVFTKAQLVEIDLSDNPISHLAIYVCRCLLNKPSLRRLLLYNIGLGKDGMEAVANILTSKEEDNGCIAKQMTKIRINNNAMGPEGCKEFARILGKTKELVDVQYSSTRASKEESDILTSAFASCLSDAQNSCLERLDLADSVFTEARSLCCALRAMKRLTYLDLGNCTLKNDGVRDVCKALNRRGSLLEYLDLSSNSDDSDGAEHVAASMKRYCVRLKVLCLYENEISCKGINSIAESFSAGEVGNTIEELQLNSI